ncbi:family 2 glycosyl transferase [Calothrix sp. NIES-4071]|nr:family 2 glycosyl transferase [Calothrix sp. NIES-4071]BAZ56383.1 family 2 glycosyl transferase [Calothrix sp. NIES-4105]
MQVISRLELPKTLETSDLYVKLNGNASLNDYIDFDASKIILHQGDTLSFNTYFNSFYESFYNKYTTLNQLEYQLKLVGEFEVSVYREQHEVTKRKLIYNQKIQSDNFSDYVAFSLPQPLSATEAGRIYLEITCLSQQGIFTEGLIATQQVQQRNVSLAIITCTFKKEAYVTKTVDAITKDKLLQNKKFKVFVVDNGKTLKHSDFEDSRVTLIPNRNVGGSGGFTKGLIEALQEGVYTHFLFMDDDIDLDSEVIYKLFPLYEYGKQDFAISGSMLDLQKKHMLYEAGALYNKLADEEGNIKDCELNITSIKRNIDLRDASELNSLTSEEEIDYGAFWFFAFSEEVVKNIGLPLPFFIKIDDVEFGLRVKKYLNSAIVAFPSIAVWHEPFYAKNTGWDDYYSQRNMLITSAIHGSLKYSTALKNISGGLIYHLLLFNYNTAKMYAKAFEDFLAGPNFIKNTDSEALHAQICSSSKSHKSQTIVAKSVNCDENYQTTKVGKIQKLLTLITLNGHLLPKFAIRDESTFIYYHKLESKRDSICKAFAKKRIVLKYKEMPALYHNELDSQAAFKILSSLIKSLLKSSLVWSNITKQWKESAKELTSISFWENYLEPRH